MGYRGELPIIWNHLTLPVAGGEAHCRPLPADPVSKTLVAYRAKAQQFGDERVLQMSDEELAQALPGGGPALVLLDVPAPVDFDEANLVGVRRFKP